MDICFGVQVYALRRLVRGLGSGRQGARQGFATALALLLGQHRVEAHPSPAATATAGSNGGAVTRPVAAATGKGKGPFFVNAGDVLTLLDTCLEAGSSMKAGVSVD